MPVGDNPLQQYETKITDATPGPSSGEIKSYGRKVGNMLLGQAAKQQFDRNFDFPDHLRQLEIRDQQSAYAALLRQQAQGKGPSLFAPALAAAQRAGTAVAASGRGANMALAGRTGAQTAARLGMGAAELRAKEQLAAQQQYAALLQAQRQADLQSRQMGVQMGTAQLGSSTQTAQGNAERGQQGVGSIVKMFVGSDPAVKTDAAPVGSYQQPYGQQPYQAQSQPGLFQGGTFRGAMSNLGDGLVGSGVTMKQNIEPIGGVNPRFADPMAGGTVGLGASQPRDVGPQQRPATAAEADAQRRLNAWFAEQQAAPAAQKHSQFVDPTQINLELDQGRSGASAGQYPELQPPPQQQAQRQGGVMGFIGGMFGGGKPGSDPDMKSGGQPVGQLSATAAQVQPYEFRYKPEFAAQEGVTTDKRVGAMASSAPGSLADNPIYAPTVQKDPNGLDRVNGGQAVMANIAVTADVARKQQQDSARLDALESMALRGASGKGARGKRVNANDVLRPPAGSAPTGQRYQALADLTPSPLQGASFGADVGSATLRYNDSPTPRLQAGVQPALDNVGRGRLATQLKAPERAAVGQSDINLDSLDASLIDRRELARLKNAAAGGEPGDVFKYQEHSVHNAPNVTPGSREETDYTQELRATKGQYQEGQMGGIAQMLREKPVPAVKGFASAGARELARRREKWIQNFALFAQDDSEGAAAAMGEPAVRLRPKDVVELLKQRGAPVSEAEVLRALKRTKNNKPIITL